MTALAIFLLLAAVVGVATLIVRDVDRWTRRALGDSDIFGETRRDIRALPEVPDAPCDWAKDEAA